MSEDGLYHRRSTCWSWGERHYSCAIAEVARLREECARLRAGYERVHNALARTHYDIGSIDAMLVSDLKAVPTVHAQD